MTRTPNLRPCPIPNCQRFRKDSQLFCPGDWRLTPPDLKDAVLREAGRSWGSPEHKAAAKAAMRAVLERLGRSPEKGSPYAL